MGRDGCICALLQCKDVMRARLKESSRVGGSDSSKRRFESASYALEIPPTLPRVNRAPWKNQKDPARFLVDAHHRNSLFEKKEQQPRDWKTLIFACSPATFFGLYFFIPPRPPPPPPPPLLRPNLHATIANMAAIIFGGAQPHPPLVQPIIFCGPGSNLYPLCTSTVTADVSQDAFPAEQVDLPKAMLPVFNRPMIAYALQQLLSAGLRHAIVFAPSEHHSTIAAALKSLILIPPTLVQSGKKNTSSTAAAAAAAAVEEASKYPNVSVSVGLNSTSAASSAPAGNSYLSANSFATSSVQSETVMRVDLLPLGPEDITNSKADSRISSSASKYKKLGTAGLISWLHSVGRLDKDPLILPVDLITQSISLTDIINSHISSVSQSPALTCLMYERGAGEGTGKEREKDGKSAPANPSLHTSTHADRGFGSIPLALRPAQALQRLRSYTLAHEQILVGRWRRSLHHAPTASPPGFR